MADVDYSIAAKVQPPKFDPMATATQAIQLGQGVLSNRLLGQQVDAKAALGRAISANTDAQGNINYGAAVGGLASDPRTAFAAPELAGTALDQHIKQTQLDTSQLALSGERWGMVSDWALSALQDGDYSKSHVIKSITDGLIGSGLFHDKDSVGQITNLVTSLGEDPDKNKAILQRVGLQAKATTERIQAMYAATHGGITPDSDADGSPVLVPGPNGTVIPSRVLKSQAQGVMAAGAPIRIGAPQTAEGVPIPEAGRPLINGTDPSTGQPYIVTAGDAARAAAAGGPGGAASAPGAPGAAPPHIAVGPAAGVTAGLEHQAAAGADMATRLTQRAAIVPQRMAALKNMGQTLDSFQPGPKADLTYKLGALATQFGLAPPSAAKGAAAQEEFNKLAAQVALDQWGSLGGTGTNEQLGTSIKANPHEAMTKMGMKNVMALLLGNEEAISAQSSAWNRYQGKHKDDPLAYQHFQEGWNRYYDPRAFQADYMAAPDLKSMEAKMSKDELAKFQQARAFAKQIKGQ